MPAPARLEWQPGHLVVDERFSLASAGVADERVTAAIERVRQRLGARTGFAFRAHRGRPDRATLVVSAAAAGLPVQAVTEDESYELTVTPQQARLTAPNPLGVLRGLETFLQLLREDGARKVVPAVRISDRPRFPWRGLLIDPCRRFQPVEVVKRTLEAMAAVKLNVLHWHLTEDQGFRIESRAYPKLHELGSEGRYYTQDQVRDVLAYARARGIRVVPEFDMPGHATSWLVAHPELGSVPGPFSLVREWGIFDNNLDPTKDEVYAFLDRFLGEMASLFPDSYLHIGGDEVTPRQWYGNAAILDYMYRHRLGDAVDLQAHFNSRVNAILRRHGKNMVGWDEVLRPDLPKDVLVQSWRGADSLARAARLGVSGILSAGYYLDHMMPASFHYLADPVPPDSTLTPEERARILGGEACMWGEFVDPQTIDSRLWPRAAAVAERLWSPAEVRDVEDMYRRLEVQSARLAEVGATHVSGHAAMLQRLAGSGPVEPVRRLLDVVEPVKFYMRGQLRRFTTETPLDRIADAARPESLAARRFQKDVEAFLAAPAASRADAGLRAALTSWRENHAALEPVVEGSPVAAEARLLSRDLSQVAATGLQALDALSTGRRADAAWLEGARSLLDQAYRPRAEVQIAVVPPVCALAFAAAEKTPPQGACPGSGPQGGH